MTLQDWIDETGERFEKEPPHRAGWQSARAFGRGITRRLEDRAHRVIPPIWDRGDWQVMVIMDACRVDLLRSVAPEYPTLAVGNGTHERGPEAIESVWSKGSCSIDWINRTFNQCPDEIASAAYVTANPFADHDAEHAQSADLATNPHLGHFRPLYKSEWRNVGGIETVPPEWVTNHAIECWRHREEYGIDRMVVHYMQPHEPFITRPEWSYQTPQDNAVLKNLVTEGYQAGTSPWQAMVNSGRVSPTEFWPIYQDNLRWVLNDLTERLLENCEADVVLSADHGNGLGEWGTWHHPPGSIAPAVRKVPWLEVRGRDTNTIQPTVDAERSDRAVETQLEALGYR